MGNCAAPPLAIIYVFSIENQIFQAYPSAFMLWKRYIDDIFFLSSMEPTQILNICNSFNKNIKFTHEMLTNNAIPFLDTVVYQEQGSFQYHLHVKPTHSNTCLPFSSFVPNSFKRNLVLSEKRTAVKRSSNSQNNKKSLKIISDRLKANGYTEKFLRQHSYNPDTKQMIKLRMSMLVI